jgi:hypothetical protein
MFKIKENDLTTIPQRGLNIKVLLYVSSMYNKFFLPLVELPKCFMVIYESRTGIDEERQSHYVGFKLTHKKISHKLSSLEVNKRR